MLCLKFGEAGVMAQCVVYEKGAECCGEADRAGKAYMILGGIDLYENKLAAREKVRVLSLLVHCGRGHAVLHL